MRKESYLIISTMELILPLVVPLIVLAIYEGGYTSTILAKSTLIFAFVTVGQILIRDVRKRWAKKEEASNHEN